MKDPIMHLKLIVRDRYIVFNIKNLSLMCDLDGLLENLLEL